MGRVGSKGRSPRSRWEGGVGRRDGKETKGWGWIEGIEREEILNRRGQEGVRREGW